MNLCPTVQFCFPHQHVRPSFAPQFLLCLGCRGLPRLMNLISTGFIRTVTIQSIRVTYAALTGTSSTYIYLHLHLQHISCFFAEALEVFHKKHDLFRQIQMNGRGLGPTSTHWLRIELALPCEFRDCESIAALHSTIA